MDEKHDIFPFEVKSLEPELLKEREKYFKGESLVSVGPKKYLEFEAYKDIATEVYNLKLKKDDVFIVGCPRSGTTVMSELVWLVTNNMDFEKALSQKLKSRCPYLEACSFLSSNLEEWRKTLDAGNKAEMEAYLSKPQKLMDKLSPPRVVKTHLPLSLLPPTMIDTAKTIYMARDPRDVAVSFYYYARYSVISQLDCDFKTYWNFFVRNAALYTPYFEHVKEAWDLRNHPNLLFLFYEEFRNDPTDVVRRVAKFLNKDYSEDQFAKLCEHLSISNMKNNKTITTDLVKTFMGLNCETDDNSVVRKGKVGGWRNYFDEEMAAQAEKWIAEQLKDTDLNFPTVISLNKE